MLPGRQQSTMPLGCRCKRWLRPRDERMGTGLGKGTPLEGTSVMLPCAHAHESYAKRTSFGRDGAIVSRGLDDVRAWSFAEGIKICSSADVRWAGWNVHRSVCRGAGSIGQPHERSDTDTECSFGVQCSRVVGALARLGSRMRDGGKCGCHLFTLGVVGSIIRRNSDTRPDVGHYRGCCRYVWGGRVRVHARGPDRPQ